MGRDRSLPPAAQVDRERQCLELRRAGITFDVIAEQVGYANRGVAYTAYKRALERTRRLSEPEAHALELDRLERLHAAVWPAALRGSLEAVDRVLRIAALRMAITDSGDGFRQSPAKDGIDDLATRRAARRTIR